MREAANRRLEIALYLSISRAIYGYIYTWADHINCVCCKRKISPSVFLVLVALIMAGILVLPGLNLGRDFSP